MLNFRFSRLPVAVFVIAALVGQGTWVLAGTTGGVTGTVVDTSNGHALAGVKIAVASPSQTAKTVTDGSGHFTFLDLSPDTYVLSAELTGYLSQSITGVTVVADNTRVVAVNMDRSLRTIATVNSRSASSLVKPGTTADVYSINPVVQQKVAVAGGGGNQDSAFSAMATVPGVAVAPGQSGWIGGAPTLSIRGGDYNQIGYEIDGVPVNRSFDNYPSGPTSSLGQQELQVYTGAPPASSSSEGLSGYVNQVIRTGTKTPFESVTIADGSPAYYHKIAAEFGGETANGRFSYYAGVGGYNQTLRVADQFNGASLDTLYGPPLGFCAPASTPAQAPSCYTGGKYNGANGTGSLILGPYNLFGTNQVVDRDSVFNFHYYFPHKDGSRDDIQALYQVNYINTSDYDSTIDQGGAAIAAAANPFGTVPSFIDGYQLKLPTGGFLPANYQSYAAPYYFPNVPTHSFDGTIPYNEEDGFENNQAIGKLQFTKSLGSNAFARAYAYSYYSDWLNTAPQCATFAAYTGYCGATADYELSSHARGASFSFADQLNPQNLLQLEGDYTTSTTLRDNNTEFYDNSPLAGAGPTAINDRTAVAVLVDSSNPSNGICYSAAATAVPCFKSATGLNSAGTGGFAGAQYANLYQAYTGTIAPAPSATCGGGACEYLVVGNGQYATYNTVTPRFYGLSLTDEFRPTAKLDINGGIRLDDYQFIGSSTAGTGARTFWYNAYDREMCIDKASQQVVAKLSAGDTSLSQACPAGTLPADFTNPAGNVTETYPVFQPRLGFTYSLSPTTVFRANYGRYGQPPNSAFEQYDTIEPDAPLTLYGKYNFQQYGYTNPNHAVPPETSSNYDFSIEHQFPSQVSVKITPFLRTTANQEEQFFLNKATAFVSALNVGSQTSRGVEFELDKGNFAQPGLSAKLAFAYTNTYIKYYQLSNGTTPLTPIVSAINQYNALTKAGGGSPCYTSGASATPGAPDPACGAGSIANPYYLASPQSTNQYAAGMPSIPYSLIPAGTGLDEVGIGYPYVGSLVLNEKIKRLSITPVLQVFAGQRYGNPLTTNGIDPTSGCMPLSGATGTAGDPRYTHGAQAGLPFDATTCGQLPGIPNTQTGAFDGIGAFAEPTELLLHMQLSYDVSKNFTLTANLTNIAFSCFGGTNAPWTTKGTCLYSFAADSENGAIGNTYNPGNAIQPNDLRAYQPAFPQQPFGFFVSGNFKL